MDNLFLEATDGHKIPVMIHRVSDAIANLVMVHGLYDHSSRYYSLMEDLGKLGISSAIMDIRGFGKSVTDSKKQLYLGEYNGWNNATDDVYTVARELKKNSKLPTFVIGFGMGADLARTFLMKYADTLAGIIFVSAGPFLGKLKYQLYDTILKIKISKHGEFYRDHALMEKIIGILNKRAKAKGQFSYITKDINEEENFIKNPLTIAVPTLAIYKSILDARRRLADPSNHTYIPENLPILFVTGEKDGVGGGVKKQKEMTDFYASMGKNAKLAIIKNGRYDLYHDDTKDVFIHLIEEFIKKNDKL